MKLNNFYGMPLLLGLCLGLMLPIAALLSSWFLSDAQSGATLQHMAHTILPEYGLTSLILTSCVGLGVAVVGSMTAAAVTLFEFPGRRVFEWLLLMPLAMPAYVLAYAYTDTLQFSGPLQTALRAWTGAQGALWPDVRSLGGAITLFILCLYPYVYLLARSALNERGVHLMEAARLLGANLPRRILTVALPMSRPAIAAGMALALMETLSDYGVGSYFGLTTFSTGIYRAWLSMGDRNAAAQLATMLLFLVAILVSVEHSAQHRLRFATARTGSTTAREGRLLPLGKLGRCVAWLVCGLPVLLGFFAPVAAMLRLVFQLVGQNPASDDASTNASALQIPWGRLFDWCFNSFYLASITAAIATAIAMALVFAQRRHASPALRWMTRTIALGYAVPGAVITVGILLPTGGLQKLWPDSPIAALLTSTVLGLIYAYLVRFCAVALQSIESGYARLPMSLDESARLLSQSGWRLWSRIHWPLMQRATWTALLLVFVDVMKELPATLMLRPFNRDTLAVVANQLARDERLAEAALPSLAIVAVGLIPVLLISRATRSKSPRKNREKSDVSIMETP